MQRFQHRSRFSKVLMLLAFVSLFPACAEKPDPQMAYGVTENVFEKSLFSADSYQAGEIDATVAQFVEPLPNKELKSFKFEVGQNRLNLLVLNELGVYTPVYHWVVEGHYDYDHNRNAGGEKNRFIGLSTTLHEDYRDRALIKVNPTVFYSKEADVDPYRFLVSEIKDKTFVVGADSLPGLSDSLMHALRTQHGLKDGDEVLVALDLVYYHLYLGEKEILRLPVDYFDFVIKPKSEISPLKLFF